MDNHPRLFIPIILAGLLLFACAPSAQAASQTECAIWLCLPAGFPAGCGAAKGAFMARIKSFKSPLPSFSSCLHNGNKPAHQHSQMTARDGVAAMIAARRICTRWYRRRSDDADECVETRVIPAHIQKGIGCRIEKDEGNQKRRYPRGCYQTIRYVDTFMGGHHYGQTHYFDTSGRDIALP